MLNNNERLELRTIFNGIPNHEIVKFLTEYLAEKIVSDNDSDVIDYTKNLFINDFKEELTSQVNERY